MPSGDTFTYRGYFITRGWVGSFQWFMLDPNQRPCGATYGGVRELKETIDSRIARIN